MVEVPKLSRLETLNCQSRTFSFSNLQLSSYVNTDHSTNVCMARMKNTTRPRSLLLSKARKHKAANVSLSSKASRTLINRHHNLQKRLNQALANNDIAAAQALQSEIDADGGLERYQQASVWVSSLPGTKCQQHLDAKANLQSSDNRYAVNHRNVAGTHRRY